MTYIRSILRPEEENIVYNKGVGRSIRNLQHLYRIGYNGAFGGLNAFDLPDLDKLNEFYQKMDSDSENYLVVSQETNQIFSEFITSNSIFKVVSKRTNKPVYSVYTEDIYKLFDNVLLLDDTSFPSAQEYSDSYGKKIREASSFQDYGDANKETNLFALTNIMYSDTVDWSSLQEDTTTIKVVSCGSIYSGAAVTPFVTDVTVANINRGTGFLIPVLYPIKVYNYKTKEYEYAYNFTFLYKTPLDKFLKYKKAKEQLASFINLCLYKDGLYFTDIEEYNIQRYETGYNKYIPVDHIQAFQQLNININNSSEELTRESVANSLATWNYPEEIQRKDARYKRRCQMQTDMLIETVKKTNNSSLALKSVFEYQAKIRDYRARIKTLLNSIDSCKELAKKALALPHELSQPIDATYETAQNALSLVKTSNSLAEQKRSFAQQSKPELSQSLQNLLDAFTVTDLIFVNKNTGESISIKDPKSSLLINLSQNSEMNLKEVHFYTNEPVKIRLNGKDNKRARVGGPYAIKATSSHLRVALLSKDSYFGYKFNGNSIQGLRAHPHSGTISLSDFQSGVYSSACLGEASSLLYKAFEKNDLAHILLAVNIWLSSANTSDVWGRSYKYFPLWSEHLEYLSASKQAENVESNPENEISELETQEESSSLSEEEPPAYTPYFTVRS